VKAPGKRIWANTDPTTPITSDASPPSKLALLAAAVSIIEDAAVTPYAGCGRLFDGCSSTTSGSRYIGMRLAPGAQHLRVHGTSSMDPAGTAASQPRFTASSATAGASGVNLVDWNAYHMSTAWTAQAVVFNSPWTAAITSSSNIINDIPSARMDRQIQANPVPYPYTEQVTIAQAAGACFWVSQRVADLETLT